MLISLNYQFHITKINRKIPTENETIKAYFTVNLFSTLTTGNDWKTETLDILLLELPEALSLNFRLIFGFFCYNFFDEVIDDN